MSVLTIANRGSAVAREQLATIDPRDVADLGVTLQSGVHYLRAAWPVDELITMYLADIAPESWTLRDEDVWVRARGVRGAISFSRLSAGDNAFRVSLTAGHTLGEAADQALDVDPSFQPGLALLRRSWMTGSSRRSADRRRAGSRRSFWVNLQPGAALHQVLLIERPRVHEDV